MESVSHSPLWPGRRSTSTSSRGRPEYISGILEYEREVERLAQEHTGEPIFNSSPDHARIVIQNIFRSASESVKILSGSLTPRVYGRDMVLDEASLFLASSHRNHVQIILEQDSIEDRRINPLLRRFAKSKSKNVELRIAPEEARKLYNFHCIVTDNDCYRYEPDRKYAVAIAAFGDATGGRRLRNHHASIWEKCLKRELVL